jgi:2-succinyl-6-hydroxy-2,4-cyclohexadiene-1-carboxylate synthase
LDHPDLVRGLCLLGASPGMVDDDERAARRRADDDLAAHIEQVGVAAFVDEWLAQPLFAGLELDDRQRAERLENSAAGLASSLRMTGAGTQDPLWERLGELHMPVLAIAGALDHKYTATLREAADVVRHARFEVIADAGHAAHLQDPACSSAILRDWLAEITPREG